MFISFLKITSYKGAFDVPESAIYYGEYGSIDFIACLRSIYVAIKRCVTNQKSFRHNEEITFKITFRF